MYYLFVQRKGHKMITDFWNDDDEVSDMEQYELNCLAQEQAMECAEDYE